MSDTVYVLVGLDRNNRQYIVKGYRSEVHAVNAAKKAMKQNKERLASIEEWETEYNRHLHAAYNKLREEGARGAADKAHDIAKDIMGQAPSRPDYLNYTVEEVGVE